MRALALAAHTSAASALPQALRLNDPLPQPGAGDVAGFAVSRDGLWIVYRADAATDETYELFSVRSDYGSAPIRLNPPLEAGRDVSAFAVGTGRAVFLSDQARDDRFELFSVPLDGGSAAIRLSPTVPANSTVSGFWISPDGTTVLFSVWESLFIDRLYRVPIDGSQAAVVIGDSGPSITPLAPTGIVELQFTPDGQRVVLEARTFDDDFSPSRLVQVRVDGSGKAPLSVPDAYTSIEGFVISQNGARVVFAQDSGFGLELYAVGIGGAGRVALAPGYVLGTFAVTPDGGRALYIQGHVYSVRTDGTQRVQLGPPNAAATTLRLTPDGNRVVFVASGDLYSAPVDGSSAATLLLGPGATQDFESSADSSRVAAVVNSGTFRALYAVPTTGGAPVLLNGPEEENRGVAPAAPLLALQGGRAVYRQDRERDGSFELFSAPLDGSQPELRVSAAMGTLNDVQSFRLLPDGVRAVYLADQVLDDTFELFGTRLDGNAFPLRYHPAFVAGPVLGDVLAFRGPGTASRVVYYADQDTDEAFELFSASRDGRSAATRISGALPSLQDDVEPRFEVSASGERVAYELDLVRGPFALYATASDAQSAPVPLDSGSSAFPLPYRFTPDETRLVYRKAPSSGSGLGLFVRAVDGSTPAVRLDPNAIPGSTVLDDFALTPAGERAVFRGDQEHDGLIELFSAPLGGASLPVRLNQPLAPGRKVEDFRIAPDGARVYYRADPRESGLTELFAVPIAGGTPLCMHPLLASDRHVTDYAIAPDGRRIVYRSDQAVAGQNELFSVPSSGPSPRHADPGVVRLTPLMPGQDVQSVFELSPDGRAVFFTVTAFPGPTELYSVPIDGSAPPELVNATLPAGGNVTGFQLAPDGSYLVYRADQRANERFELFRVPLAGGRPVALDDLPAFADVGAFQIAPDSAFVVYRADRSLDEVYELFAAPLDLGEPSRRLSNLLLPEGDVQPDFLALPGGRALFRADQAADEVFELFLGDYARGSHQRQ